MVQLVGPDLADRGRERLGLEQVGVDDVDPPAQVLGKAEPLGAVTDQARDVIPPVEQQLGQERAVLAREAGHERRPMAGLGLMRHAGRYGDDDVASERRRPSCARGGSTPFLSSS